MKFKFDPRELPDNLKTTAQKDAFKRAVLQRLNSNRSAGKVTQDAPLFAAVAGMLVLDGYTDPKGAGFDDQFWVVRGEAAGFTLESDKKTKVPNEDVYEEVANVISQFDGHFDGNDDVVYYQELASVSRKLLDNTDEVPVDDPTFVTQIRIYDDEYVAQGPRGAGGLDIPELSDPDSAAAPDDIRRANIESVAVIAAAYPLEQARLFDAVDRIMETWWNGQLPVGFDKGSKALDELFWASDTRLTPTARHMQYGRVLGVPGGEVSTEVQPNTQFDELFRRFVASLAEYDRQQRIGNIVGNQRRNALTLTAELVRSTGRNLAANASLYGWGGTQFAARRIADHIKKSFAILNSREIQAAYGVDGPWKVVERVSQEFGAVPNLVKWQTQATATKTILDIVAKYSTIWSGSPGKPLFNDPATSQDGVVSKMGDGFDSLADELHELVLIAKQAQAGGHVAVAAGAPATTRKSKAGTRVATSAAAIDDRDRDELMRQAGNYIAVNGIKDEAVEELSQPAETQYAPSIPSLTSAMPSTNGGGGIDQLREMVAQGQVPSLDQLKSIVMPTAG